MNFMTLTNTVLSDEFPDVNYSALLNRTFYVCDFQYQKFTLV